MSLIGIITVLATVACLALDIRPVAVVSGSMEPAVSTGALVLHKTVPASQLEVGDVVTVARTDGNGVVTHRIASLEPAEDGQAALTLRGDANQKDDPETYVVDKADRMDMAVPAVGGALMWMRAHPIATAIILLALLAFSLWPAPRFVVHTADGRVLKNLTRREAAIYVEEAKRARSAQASEEPEVDDAARPAPPVTPVLGVPAVPARPVVAQAAPPAQSALVSASAAQSTFAPAPAQAAPAVQTASAAQAAFTSASAQAPQATQTAFAPAPRRETSAPRSAEPALAAQGGVATAVRDRAGAARRVAWLPTDSVPVRRPVLDSADGRY
jgi:signal peptidase